MTKTIDDILDRVSVNSSRGLTKVGLRAELLTLMTQAAPGHKPELYPSDPIHDLNWAYNQAIDDYLANIRELFQ